MGVLLMASCSKDNATDTTILQDIDNLTASEQSAAIDLMSEDIGMIIEDAYTVDELNESNDISRTPDSLSYLPDCVTMTTVVMNGHVEKTIDFGDGCTLPNGHVLSGIIFMSYLHDTNTQTKEILASLQNFFIDGVSIEGSKSVFRERSNANDNPQSTFTVDILVTWPNGAFASRNGQKVREWIEGYGSGNWGDNIFLITGNRNTIFPSGASASGDITNPLRRELACNFLVSGTVDLQRNDWTGTLDFGDGACDNLATITLVDGTVHQINL
ncbi:MAG: hypothetical protein HRT68_05045 [Flavobacteriaceae bacterium]|nr:hypothetical protein [Flavobacteriaceae bacterium]